MNLFTSPYVHEMMRKMNPPLLPFPIYIYLTESILIIGFDDQDDDDDHHQQRE